MAGPSSAPRGERPGARPGAWETELLFTGEQLADGDGQEPPSANRATRRAAAKARRRKGKRR